MKILHTIHLFFILIIFLSSYQIQHLSAQDAEKYFVLANQFYKSQKYDEAIQNYQNALKINPTFAKASHNLGNVYYALGEPIDAMKYYNQSIQNAPDDFAPYISRGFLYLDLKKIKEAENDLQKSLKLKPDAPEGHYLLGSIRFNQNKKDEACKFWKMAAAKGHIQANQDVQNKCESIAKIALLKDKKQGKKPTSAKDFIKSGEEKLEKRDYQNALLDFEKAIELDKKSGQAYFGIGNAKFAQGEQDNACVAWKKSLKLGYKKSKEMLKGVCNE